MKTDTLKIVLCLLPVAVLTGCDSKPTVTEVKKEQRTSGGIFQPQLDAMEKAKGVEKTLQQQAEDRQKKIEEQEKK